MTLELALPLARKAAEVLKEKGIENPRLDAELLLASVLEIDRLKLYLQHDRPVTPAELETFRGYIRRRIKREPVQYIIGDAAFRDLVLRVDRRALIPRPETEVLVGEVLKWLRARGEVAETPRGLDIGTGSGAIALSLAQEAGLAMVATDVSADAISLARENARVTGLDGLVEFREGETWAPIEAGERFDVIVSNPPYVAEQERAALAPEVVGYEPERALFAPEAGMAVLSAIIGRAHEYLRAGGLLALEMGAGQGAAVVEAVNATARYTQPRIIKDLAGRERIVITEAL